MKTVHSSEFTVRSSQFTLRLRTAYCVLICCLLAGCAPTPSEDSEFSYQGIPRLAKYYPEVDANGDTTYKTVPVEKFINQHGDSFSTAQLRGKISVVQFFFASCEGICPIISDNMVLVQKEFAGNQNVKLISFTVDPARDSVPVLKKYAERFSCDSAQWTLLTGEKKKIYDMVRYGFILPDVEPGNGDEEDFIHSNQLVLVDRNSIIRGYYSGTDTAEVRMLLEDVHTLLNEK